MIDLNADLGEECGDDIAMLSIVSSANVAAGGHAGGGQVLLNTVAEAAARGVRIGAHPSYPDRENFGRISPISNEVHPALFMESLINQILDVAAAAEQANAQISYVKPHGALYNDAMVNEDVALLVVRATRHASDNIALPGMPALPVMGQPGSTLQHIARVLSVPFIAEGFADRAYTPQGNLVPRSQPGAVLHDLQAITSQVLQMVQQGTVTAIDGTVIPMPIQTICVHGDTPGAVAIAQAVKTALSKANA